MLRTRALRLATPPRHAPVADPLNPPGPGHRASESFLLGWAFNPLVEVDWFWGG